MVCFDIFVKKNVSIEPSPKPQLFKATMSVLGDRTQRLDSRDVCFLVPPKVEIHGPD